MSWEINKKFQDAFVVGRIENNDVSRKEYAKELNKILLENNDNLPDNMIGIDCVLAPQDPKDREELEILFAKLRKERNSICPYLTKYWVHFESARGIDW